VRDIFIHITENNDSHFGKQAKAYFDELFPASINSFKTVNGLALTFSTDSEDETGFIPVIYEANRANLLISGEYDIPDFLKLPDTGNINQVESITRLFELYGEKLFEKLSGSFNAVIHYFEKKEIVIVNSKLGLYPLYYTQRKGELLVSSRLGIFRNIYGESSINHAVIMQYCLYNYPVSADTFINEVSLLPAASVLKFYKQKTEIRRYWEVDNQDGKDDTSGNFKKSIEFLDYTFDNIIRKKCKSQGKIGISLTGGWDGRLILAYALKYLHSDQIMLYSHGTPDNPDILLPAQTAENLKLNYIPVLLNEPAYLDAQLKWAGKTIEYSDGLRQVSRAHYLYNMDMLNRDYGIRNIISGIGGSNLLKSTNYHACDVFNHNIIELVETNDIIKTIKDHFEQCKRFYPDLFMDINFERFLSSYDLKEWNELHSAGDNRFIHFLTREAERKYFGPELQSYRHLVRNYSPFFDDEFINALTRTVFFNGNRIKGLAKSYYISKLYAKLTVKNNKLLAREITDRGFSMYDAAQSYLFPLMIYKYFRGKSGRRKAPDYFNNRLILNRYAAMALPGISLPERNPASNRLFLENYISAVSYFNHFKK
jgi:asparagine synthetase B (glutamine-hydrolysing)